MDTGTDAGEIRSRIRGAFAGVAVGDALGAAVEFMTPGEIAAKHGVLREIIGGGWLRLKAGAVTDDTQMSLCVARALVAARGWDMEGIARNFAEWLKGKPVDVGSTCRKGIRNFMLKGELEVPFNDWDAGNGAVMRIAPVAIFTLGDEELLARHAVAQAHVTHNHPLSDAACVMSARMTQHSILGVSKTRLRRELEPFLAEFPTFRFDPYRGMATGYVVDTMQTVFHHFFRGSDFETTLVGTVNQGGDADTTGAIAGMLAGAYYGYENIPRRWLKRLDRKVMEEIDRLAGELARLSPMGERMGW
jgi:ADP-ribosyl-[dinitrogen reductase] hydrolase